MWYYLQSQIWVRNICLNRVHFLLFMQFLRKIFFQVDLSQNIPMLPKLSQMTYWPQMLLIFPNSRDHLMWCYQHRMIRIGKIRLSQASGKHFLGFAFMMLTWGSPKYCWLDPWTIHRDYLHMCKSGFPVVTWRKMEPFFRTGIQQPARTPPSSPTLHSLAVGLADLAWPIYSTNTYSLRVYHIRSCDWKLLCFSLKSYFRACTFH